MIDYGSESIKNKPKKKNQKKETFYMIGTKHMNHEREGGAAPLFKDESMGVPKLFAENDGILAIRTVTTGFLSAVSFRSSVGYAV